jgi:Terminase large subunit, T4likevirus-type, N-terminal
MVETEHELWFKPKQREVLDAMDVFRFVVWIAGRRSGKTRTAVGALAKASAVPRARSWYVAPTRQMAKDIAWEPLQDVLRPMIVAVNASDLTLTLHTGATITLHSADEPDRLRGRSLDLVVLDEFAQITPETWDAVLRPSLATTNGKALFIGTPDGRNWAYDLFRKAQSDETGQWKALQHTTAECGWVPAMELKAARESMDSRLYRQEFEATFETAAGRVYDAFRWADAPDGNLSPVTDGDETLLIGLDFNINPMSAVFALKRVDELHVLDAWQIQTSNTEEMAQEIRRRYPDRRITVYPDPSGNARKTSAPAGQTDFTILRRHGFNVIAPTSAPIVVDRINAVQALLCNAEGRRRLLIDPRAKALVSALDKLSYKVDTNAPDKTGGFDHITDALGYMVWSGCNPLRTTAVSTSTFTR